jgi:hypothetical protein
MAEDTAKAQSVAAVSSTAARLSFVAAATFVVLLAALHFIKPGLDPSWHFISEYAIGDYGWIMVLAFLSLASSYVSLFLALRSQLQTIAGRIGLECRSRSSFDGNGEDVVCWPGMCRRASEVASHASIGLASTHRTYARRAAGTGAHKKGEAVRLPA